MVSAATMGFYSPRKILPAPETKRRRQRVQTDERQRADGGAGAAGKDDADPAAAARGFSHASSGGPCAQMFLCKRAADIGKGGARCGCAGAASALRSA